MRAGLLEQLTVRLRISIAAFPFRGPEGDARESMLQMNFVVKTARATIPDVPRICQEGPDQPEGTQTQHDLQEAFHLASGGILAANRPTTKRGPILTASRAGNN
jgi:hypothetical protein